ncbi:TlpA family protein disulfide reductase [Pseudoduganella namucuonensis]|uniref:TlpA family protein disulfide reductase n=1 Tax=Pseudoduganella namucuonensis TaxID=1035707 RepID=UPI001E464D16|nr:TlpA disulfide reductase family protein [Pseudoduganella namucuonensis]
MVKKNYLIYAIAAIGCAAAGAWFQQAEKAPIPAPKAAAVQPGGPVDELFLAQLNDAKGAKQALAQWKGRHLVVNFWAPWCGPCVEEMPELSRLQAEVSAKNVQVIGIGIDTPSNIADFSEKNKISYPVYVAGMGGTELSRKFGNNQGGLPYTVLIGADGQVLKTYLGRLKFDELRADLARL